MNQFLDRHSLGIKEITPALATFIIGLLLSIGVFYSLHKEMADLLGIQNVGWAKRERDGQFSEIRFDAAGITGLPKSVKQASWNITLAEPAHRSAKVIGILPPCPS